MGYSISVEMSENREAQAMSTEFLVSPEKYFVLNFLNILLIDRMAYLPLAHYGV